MARFNVGEICIYRGPVQANLLAPGDAVEVEADLKTGYRIKLSTPFSTASFNCTDNELASFVLPNETGFISPFDKSTSPMYPGLVDKDKRKEEGQCTNCGTLLPISFWGLLPCPRCDQPTPVKW